MAGGCKGFGTPQKKIDFFLVLINQSFDDFLLPLPRNSAPVCCIHSCHFDSRIIESHGGKKHYATWDHVGV